MKLIRVNDWMSAPSEAIKQNQISIFLQSAAKTGTDGSDLTNHVIIGMVMFPLELWESTRKR